MTFIVHPAIDVRDGRVVRLRQGDYAQETRYAMSPLALAREYAGQGAEWLHLVDLDAARLGGNTLHPLVRAITATTPLRVQVGGGVRTQADVQGLLDAGAARVVVGSVAVRKPGQVIDWLRQFGADRLTIALDTRRNEDGEWRLPIHGWTESSPHTLFQLARDYADAGLRNLLCTDIARDGMLAGPATELYAELHARLPSLAIQASGGIRDADDVRAVREAGCAGAVLGKALLDGNMTLQEALAC